MSVGLSVILLIEVNFILNKNDVIVNTLNPLSANPTKWSNTKTIRRLLPPNSLSVFDYFVRLAYRGLRLK